MANLYGNTPIVLGADERDLFCGFEPSDTNKHRR